jgi:TolB-like protein
MGRVFENEPHGDDLVPPTCAYLQVKSRLDLKVSDLGATSLKNIAEPVRVYSVEVGKAAATPKVKFPPRRRLVAASSVLAAVVVAAGAAWYWTAGRTAPIVAASEPVQAVHSGVPTVAILPFVNATGNPQYDTATQRVGQKTRDVAGNAIIWRIVGKPGGAASAADPIEAGRQLNADYVVTGNLEAGGEALRVTFQVADVHSGARLWSGTTSPVLESGSAAAAEDELSGRAEWLLREAILNAEFARLSSTGDIAKTAWGCAVGACPGPASFPRRSL